MLTDPDRVTTFLNVDLDIVSRSDLAPFAEALNRVAYPLHLGPVGRRHIATFELRNERETTDPDRAIRAFCRALQKLDAKARRHFDGARSRVFDIGVQAAPEPHSFHLRLKPETLAAAAALDVEIAVTVYAPYPRPRARAGAKKPAG